MSGAAPAVLPDIPELPDMPEALLEPDIMPELPSVEFRAVPPLGAGVTMLF